MGFIGAGLLAWDADGTNIGHRARGLHVGRELVHLETELVRGDEPGGVQGQDKNTVHLLRPWVWVDESGPGEDTGEYLDHQAQGEASMAARGEQGTARRREQGCGIGCLPAGCVDEPAGRRGFAAHLELANLAKGGRAG